MNIPIPEVPTTQDIPTTPNPQVVDIKAQFREGPGEQQQMPIPMTAEEQAAERQRLIAEWEEQMPFMEAKYKYDNLQMKLFEQEFLLGVRPVTTIPGLLGMELAMREIKCKEFMGSYMNELTHRMEEQKQAEQKKQQESSNTDTQAPGNDATTN